MTLPPATLTRSAAAVLLAVTAATAGLALLQVTGPLRLAVTVVFVLVVPGWAVVAFAGPPVSSAAWAVAIGVSVAIDVLVAEAMLALHAWHPTTASAVVLGASAVLLVVHLVRPANAGGAR